MNELKRFNYSSLWNTCKYGIHSTNTCLHGHANDAYSGHVGNVTCWLIALVSAMWTYFGTPLELDNFCLTGNIQDFFKIVWPVLDTVETYIPNKPVRENDLNFEMPIGVYEIWIISILVDTFPKESEIPIWCVLIYSIVYFINRWRDLCNQMSPGATRPVNDEIKSARWWPLFKSIGRRK